MLKNSKGIQHFETHFLLITLFQNFIILYY